MLWINANCFLTAEHMATALEALKAVYKPKPENEDESGVGGDESVSEALSKEVFSTYVCRQVPTPSRYEELNFLCFGLMASPFMQDNRQGHSSPWRYCRGSFSKAWPSLFPKPMSAHHSSWIRVTCNRLLFHSKGSDSKFCLQLHPTAKHVISSL
jgi:hypothetical protein